MEIKPVQIKPVTPLGVKPVTPVAPVVKIAPTNTTNESTKEEAFNQLFGDSENDVNNDEVVTDIKETAKKAVDKAVKNMKEKKDGKEKKEVKEKKEEKFTGPREVRVYGMTLWTEEDANVTLDDIRKKIVEEYHFPEFSASRTNMSFDSKTGIVVPVIKFEKKG